MTSHEFLTLLQNDYGWETESITHKSRIEDAVQWDSLEMLGFISVADKHLAISVDAERVVTATTIADLLALVADGITKNHAA